MLALLSVAVIGLIVVIFLKITGKLIKWSIIIGLIAFIVVFVIPNFLP